MMDLRRSGRAPKHLATGSLLMVAAVLFGLIDLVFGATPPDRVNFQGILRDATGTPMNGPVEMTLRYLDAETGGNEIMVEAHLAAGTGAVVVDNGLFNVPLGTGALTDGSAALPGDPYTTLSKLFRDFTGVWVEIEIGSAMGPEILSPPVRVAASPYALNAAHLEGRSSGEFLDTSASVQAKAGSLSLDDLDVLGGDLRFSSAPLAPGIFVSGTSMTIRAGDNAADSLFLSAGVGAASGSLQIHPSTGFSAQSTGSFRFYWTGVPSIPLLELSFSNGMETLGNLHVGGPQIEIGALGTRLNSSPSGLTLTSGLDPSSDITLSAGAKGRLEVLGNGPIRMESGDGSFHFLNAATAVETALLDLSGNLRIDGDLDVESDVISLGVTGALLRSGSGQSLLIRAGSSDFDDLLLTGGNGADDGSLTLNGEGPVELRSGDGSFHFIDGSTASTSALLDGLGHLQLDGDLTVSGNDITAAANLDLNSGPGATNFVALVSNGNVFNFFDNDNNSSSVVSWCVNGSCIAPGTQMQLDESGNLRAGGTVSQNQFDLAEAYLMGEPIEPGDVVRLHPQIKGAVLRSAGADDATVLGVVSERPGVLLGGAPFGAERLEQMWGAEMKARFLEERNRLMDLVRSRDIEPGPEKTRPEAVRAAAQHSAEDEAITEAAALQAFYAEHFAPVALAGRVPVKVDASFGAIEPGDPLAPSPVPGVAMKADGSGPVVGIALERFSEGRGKVEAFISRGVAPAGSADDAGRRLSDQIESRTPDPRTGIQRVAGHFQVVLDSDEDDAESRFSIFRDGRDAILASEVFRVDERGDVFAKGALRPASMDLAEQFAVSEAIEPGDVLVADPDAPGRYRPCTEAGDPSVVGVVAEAPGVLLGSGFERMAAVAPELAVQVEEARLAGDRPEEARAWRRLEARFLESHAPVSLSGTVLVKVDAGYGAVRVGDLLTTSSTPGHAMRSDEARSGTIIGKALESIEQGTGRIRMLVMLR